jgi:hypothetical protein
MNPFDMLAHHKIMIKRADGTQQETKASISEKGISIPDITVKIMEGDEITTTNAAGIVETYKVDNVLYSNNPNLPAYIRHISIKYTKLGAVNNKVGGSVVITNSQNVAVNSSTVVSDESAHYYMSLTSDADVKEQIEQLVTELRKPEKNKEKIRSIFNYIFDKGVDVALAILVSGLVKYN